MSSTTNICDNIFEAIRKIDPNHIILQDHGQPGGLICHQNFTCLDMGDGTVGAFPLNMSMQYFRGENDRFEECFSALDRVKDKDDRMIWQIKTRDFILLLQRNPQIQHAINQKEYIEFTALAQHYGFPTRMLDVTNDILIAAYFATHDSNPITGAFEVKKSGIGKIRWSVELFQPEGRLVPIGMQPLSRPGAQSAFGIYLGEEEDYAKSSSFIEFKQDAAANEKFHQMILAGPQQVYPLESINILANRIKNSPCVTSEAVDIFCQENGKPQEEVKEILRRKKIHVVDAPVADWCLLQGMPNGVPSFTRNKVLRPAVIIG